MTLPTFYDAGTASVANGATTITFHDALMGTVAQPNFKAGDLFCDPAQPLVPPQRIESVDIDAGTAELAVGWPGTSMTSDLYEVRYVGDVSRSTAQTRRVIEELSTVQANGRGLFFRFSDSTTDSDPGAGYLRLNNADPTAATAAYIDDIDADGATISGEIDTWDDADALIRGRLWLRSIADPSVFRAYSVTGTVANGTGYRKLTLTHVGGSGSFAADDELMVAFTRTGDKGDGYVTDGTVADPSELAALESEDPGYLVFVTDLGTDFGAYSGRSGVVELIAGPEWRLVAIYTGPQGVQGDKGWSPQLVAETDGARRVLKLAGYVGGAGAAPTADVGSYLKADGTFTAVKADALDVRGETGAAGLDGASQFVRVDFVATTNVNLAAGLANGAAAIDGVVPATGKIALLTAQTASAENGLYVCPAAGAASRHPSFASFDSMPGVGVRVMEGTAKGDTLWFCNSNKGGTLGTTALTFAELSLSMASQAEAEGGTENTKAMTALRTRQALGKLIMKRQIFTVSGTYTPDPNMVFCEIECQGAGGGGGGVAGVSGNTVGGVGGGGGAYSRKLATKADIGASKSVTVGAKGTGGAAGNNAGSAGGSSSVGSLCTAPGGSGGSFSAYGAVSQTGANAGTGDITVPGQHNVGVIGSLGTNPGLGLSSGGGSSPFGRGGAGASSNDGATAGANATGYGAGGSGASADNTTSTAAGGDGTNGLVVVTEFCLA